MYVIVAYDVGVERVNKVKAFLRRYLTWVQNSVLEGEISESNYMKIKNKLSKIIHESDDSIILYIFSSNKLFTRETIGVKKGEPEDIVI